MGKLVCLLVLAQSSVGSAGAHSWYPRECCSDNDCRPVPCEELIESRYGLTWRGQVIFNERQTHASLDDRCHVCITSYGFFAPNVPVCVFIPSPTS